MCVYIYIYIYIFIHMYLYIYIYTCIASPWSTESICLDLKVRKVDPSRTNRRVQLVGFAVQVKLRGSTRAVWVRKIVPGGPLGSQ